jgi:hypothetical protein
VPLQEPFVGLIATFAVLVGVPILTFLICTFLIFAFWRQSQSVTLVRRALRWGRRSGVDGIILAVLGWPVIADNPFRCGARCSRLRKLHRRLLTAILGLYL